MRTPRRWRSIAIPRTAAAAVTVVAVGIAVAVGLGFRHTQSDSSPRLAGAATSTSAAAPSAALAIRLRPTAPRLVAAATRAPRPKPKPHDVVLPAAPTAFEIKGAAFDIKARVCQMDYVRPLDPPGDQLHTVCWVRDTFGVAPGSRSGGSSYILGHSWARQQLVFNPMSEFAMRHLDLQKPRLQGVVPTYPVAGIDGYKVTLRTPNGTLTYVVSRAFAVAKARAGDVGSLIRNIPNRVVLITCAVANGQDADYNIVVDAY